MSDDTEVLEFKPKPQVKPGAGRMTKEPDEEADDCPAFGFLRGIRDRALAVEFRFRDGNSEWFPYSWLGPWRFNPSAGLLLKFTGDLVTLVLVRGSNLNALIRPQGVNLTDRGLQRQRILWVREMSVTEIQTVAGNGPTIERIEIVEFESQMEVTEWLQKYAPLFVPKER